VRYANYGLEKIVVELNWCWSAAEQVSTVTILVPNVLEVEPFRVDRSKSRIM
jgi:hypothetical protein